MAGPQFFLDISMRDRAGHVSVNGIPVLRNYDGDRVETTLPVTHLILPGDNRIEWELLVEDDAFLPFEASVTATLRAAPDRVQAPQPLTTVNNSAAIDQDAVDPEGAGPTPLGAAGPTETRFDPEYDLATVMRRFTLSLPLPGWAWAASTPIPDNDAVRDALVDWYRYLHGLLRDGRTEMLEQLHAEKAQELAAAYGVDNDAALQEIALPYVATDPDWRLEEPDWDEVIIEQAADARLVRLFDPSEGCVTVFRDELGLFWSFDFWLRIEGGQWVIAR